MKRLDEKTFQKVELPQISKHSVSVEEYGAKSGIHARNTKEFNEAIENVSRKGGGKVIIPEGIWYTGPIQLRSHVELHLKRGAYVVFQYNKEEYPLIKTNYEGNDRIRATSPIYAYDEEDIAITGDGIIDGQGELWRPVKKMKLTETQWNKLTQTGVTEGGMWYPSQSSYDGMHHQDIKPDEENALERAENYYDFYRPVMVSLIRCRRVLIDGVTLINSPAWNLHPLFCEHVTINKVTIRNPWFASNGDGLDLESCRYVNIFDTTFDVGDDAICLKAGKNGAARKIQFPTEYVTIKGCTVYHGHGGFVVGSEMSRGVRNVVVENCTFIGTDIGIRFKSTLGRGGVVENIQLSNIRMTNIVQEAILFSMRYSGAMDSSRLKQDDIPEFKNIELDNITCDGAAAAFSVYGLEQLPIHDITIRDSVLRANSGVCHEYAETICFNNVSISVGAGEGKASSYNNVDITKEMMKESLVCVKKHLGNMEG